MKRSKRAKAKPKTTEPAKTTADVVNRIALPDPAATAPSKMAANGRTDRDELGRFVDGHPGGPGRPRRPDLFAIAAEHAERESVDLRTELWGVVKTLLASAKAGDVQASREVLGRLTDPDPSQVELVVSTPSPPPGPPVPGPADMLVWAKDFVAAIEDMQDAAAGMKVQPLPPAGKAPRPKPEPKA